MATPQLLKDIFPGANGSFPLQPTVVGKTLFFSAQDGSSGRELWRTDGTPMGTFRLKDIYPGSASSEPNYLLADGNRLLFTARDRKDETQDDHPDYPNVDYYIISGRTLWSSDGTGPGTNQVVSSDGWGRKIHEYSDISGYYGSSYGRSENVLSLAGGGFYESEQDYLDDFSNPGWFRRQPSGELIESKGGYQGGYKLDIGAAYQTGSILYYTRNDGPWEGYQLKAYDFRASSKVVLASGIDTFSDPVAMGNSLSFTVKNGSGQTVLWRSNNGSAAGTAAVAPIPTGSAQFTAVGSSVYFTAPAAGGVRHLWRSNGTAAGTKRVSTVPVVTSDSASLASLGDRVVFAARDPVAGVELWSSDGTAAGTQRVADIVSGAGSSNPKDFAAVGSTVYF